jgi:legumain
MKFLHLILFTFLLTVSLTIVNAKRYAVLVATTKSWVNYKHQSSVLHAYQTLRSNGLPSENIITMVYDDIANNPLNPERGVIRNHPKGPNVNLNVKKDYVGQNVNAKNFIAVLTGNSSAATGPVLHSNAEDSLFIYIVGYGAVKYLSFPTGPGILGRQFVQILEDLRAKNKIKQIYVNIETSYAASLLDGLSTRNKILVNAATNQDEFPYATYCSPKVKICYGSLYGVAWTQYSDRLRVLKSGEKRTVFDQFNHVRFEVALTHVNLYGDFSLGNKPLSEFLGYMLLRKSPRNDTKVGFSSYDDSKHSQIYGTEKDFGINTEERDVIKNTIKQIFERLRAYGHETLSYENANKIQDSLSVDDSNTYEQVIQEFHRRCININENPYALQEISKFIHVCEKGVNLDDQIRAMDEICTSEHRLLSNIH